eukprot:TRINITY_DN2405_c0_g1_i1.p1 TRINITY_DN2405_c0_g1~~TRINITY_DN2405_c0_g1_i1.p1  ORF type:complete len:908 (-),score=273.83 TRINITY_DN2405_c0_g1_i1:67-2790(-)
MVDDPTAPEVQRQKVKTILENTSLKEDDTWYLLPYKWWIQWKNYVHYDDDDTNMQNPAHPGPINNADLLEGETRLKNDLIDGSDYYMVPASAWNFLLNRYSGGPEIQRKVIKVGNGNQLQLEVYLLTLHVYKKTGQSMVSRTDVISFMVSKAATVKYLKNKLSQHLSLAPHNCRLWGEIDGQMRLLTETESLEDARLVDENAVVLESRQANSVSFVDGPPQFRPENDNGIHASTSTTAADVRDLSGPVHGYATRSSYNNPYAASAAGSSTMGSYSSGASSNTGGLEKGVCGLSNLGNTCFMNSALQCLSNTQALTQYFLADRHRGELNTTNPLGMQGKIAEHYGDLIHKVWSGKFSSVSPTDFKWQLGKFAPQFSGYRQHDSQELLAFLLDGLHEDLNRVTLKPFVEAKDYDGREDPIIAAESWNNHLLRNQSIIVDTFMGQLKSTLVCPDCGKVSITFDPFMYLSLPLPMAQERAVPIILCNTVTGEMPVKYAVNVSKRAKIGEMRQALAVISGMKAEEIILTDVCFGKVYSFLDDTQAVSVIRPNDITVGFCVGPRAEGSTLLQVTQRRPERNSYSKSTNYSTFGMPFLVTLPPGGTNVDVYRKIWTVVKRLVSPQNGQSMDVDAGEAGDNYPDTFPFQVRHLDRSSIRCGKCNSYSCPGCPVDPDDALFNKMRDSAVSLDWHAIAPGERVFDEQLQKETITHPSAKGDDSSSGLSVRSCLELFLTKEKLSPDDAWYCPQCKVFREATKKFDLWAMPPVLVIHLKRFQYNRWSRDKIDAFVDFPVTSLDLSEYVMSPEDKANPPIYDLFAVSNHSGGLGGGHYTAVAKNSIDSEWYSFNDSSAYGTSDTAIKSASAYVLFYKKRGQEVVSRVPSAIPTASSAGSSSSSSSSSSSTSSTSTSSSDV